MSDNALVLRESGVAKSDNALVLDRMSQSYGTLEVLRGFDLIVQQGEFVALVGPSGCGKTTLLNLLSGNEAPSSGSISRKGVVRMVYQQDGLLPWLTVVQNIALGLRHVPKEADRTQQAGEMLRFIGLDGFGESYPHQLSGGMKQRVELARALAGESDILLMDEPFSALDYLTRLRMRQELSRLLSERPRTVVFVTHDIDEAAQLADRIVVLSARPAHIVCELTIDLPRPRIPTHPQVVAAVQRILTEMGVVGA